MGPEASPRALVLPSRAPDRRAVGRAVGRSTEMFRSQSLTPLLLLLLTACGTLVRDPNWRDARRDSSTQAPDPAITPEAVIQVYAARTVGVKGVLGVHTWIAVKRSGAPKFTRYEVIGWGVDRGLSAVRVDRTGPDNYWFGRRPDLLVDVQGDGV